MKNKIFIKVIFAVLFVSTALISCKCDDDDGVNPSPDVYVVGYEYNRNNDRFVAKLWKNGIIQNLTDGTNSANANSVYVSNNDVYVAGENGNKAVLWKNGIAQNLTDGTNDAEAYSVYVYNNDVYVAGTDSGKAVLWKNGVARNLTNGTNSGEAYCVLVK